MCFQKKTTIIKSGLGDAQYAQLQGNQGTLGENLETGFTGTGTRFNTVDSGIAGLKTDIGGITTNVNTGLNSGFSNIQTLLDNYNQGMNTQFANVNTGVGNNATSLAANNQALGTLQTDVTGGFNQAGNRFDTLDTATGNIQGSVDQGFVDQAQGFSDAQADRTTQFTDSNTALNTGFADTGAALQQGFGDASTQLTNTQTEVLGGQNSLQGSLDVMSDDATTYANQSLENQAAMQTNQDGFQSSFDTYAERYGEDTSLANKTRADMQLANANANQRLREDIGGFAQAASSQVDDVSQGLDRQLKTLGNTVEGGFSEAKTDTQVVAEQTAGLERQFAAGLAQLDSGQVTQARDMAKIAASQTDLDMGMRQEFTQLGNAFDDNGKLIESTIDEQGNTISRAMDEQGNLILNSFDVSGQGLGTKTINLRTALSNLNNLQNQQGANASMGNLSPASSGAIPDTGFASPFARTG